MEPLPSRKADAESSVLGAQIKLESKASCNKPSANITTDSAVAEETSSTKISTAIPSKAEKCEVMDTNNSNNSEGENKQAPVTLAKDSPGTSEVRLTPMHATSLSARIVVESAIKHRSGTKSATVREFRVRQTSSGRVRSFGSSSHGLLSPDFPSVTGTPTSASQLFPLSSSALFAIEGIDFTSPMGSGQFSPLTSARIGRKRQLSISPLSSSSIDLNSLIRTSPTSLVNYITNSRSSSAGSIGHLSPSLFSNTALFQAPHGRPLQLSLRNSGYPLPTNSTTAGQMTNSGQEDLDSKNDKAEVAGVAAAGHVTIKEEQCEDSLFQDRNLVLLPENGIKMEVTNETLLPRDSHQTTTTLETVREESVGAMGSSEDEGRHADITDYSSAMAEHEFELDTKKGILDDKPKRVYYNYSSVEEPHNNQCRWADCRHQCDKLDSLVRHVNSEHIYRDSRKEFVCYWTGCVREKKPFKAQYMLLVHMRRHTGEKPHKCTYEGCNKAYSRLENLKTHLRSHTGERPYVCKYESCGKAFSNASDCAKHMNRTHTDDKPYACPNPGCTKRYTDPSSRRKHVKNCQVNKRARTEDRAAMSAADEESSAEIACTRSSGSKRTSKPRKSEKKKGNLTNAPSSRSVTQDHSFGGHAQPTSGVVSDHGYFSGGSQGQASSSQMTYTPSEYDTEYPSVHGDEEISLILQQQRLSDPNDVATTMHQPATGGYIATNQIGLSDHVTPNVRASRQSGGGSSMPAGSMHPTPPPSLFQHPQHVPSHSYRSSHLEYSHLAQPPHSSQLTPHQPSSNPHAPHLATSHHPHDRMNPYGSRKHNPNTSTGYSTFRSYSPPKAGIVGSQKSPSDDSSVLSGSFRSSILTNSYSTFSSNSSRVSSPCSNVSGRSDMLRPQPPISPNYNQVGFANTNMNLHAQVNRLESSNTGYPLKQSLKMTNSYPPREAYGRRQSSDNHSERSWQYSSQSSRYSFSGSELSDELLESLPAGVRRDSFAKKQPLPFPESMQHDFIGMECVSGPGGQNGFIEMNLQQHSGDGTISYLDHIQFDHMDHSNSDPLPTTLTLPLHHLDGTLTNIGMGMEADTNSLSDHVQGGYFSQEAPSNDYDMIFSSLGAGSSSNMIVGDMSSFANTLPDENLYLEHLISSQVK